MIGGLEERCPGWKKIEKLTIGRGGGRLFGTRDYVVTNNRHNII